MARDIRERVEAFSGFFSSVFNKDDDNYFDELPSVFCKNVMPIVTSERKI